MLTRASTTPVRIGVQALSELTDGELLRQFCRVGDQQAFTVFVHRHFNLVYSVAIRRVGGDDHLARDVAQSVFEAALKKAPAIAEHRVVASWLYTSACFAAAKAVRAEQRRRRRESQAETMEGNVTASAHDTEWARIRPEIDVAMATLKARDREALLLRFFEGRTLAEVGQHLRLGENATRMRIDRALAKLRSALNAKGVTSTAAVLAGALTSYGVLPGPAGLAQAVASTALAGGVGAGAVGLFSWLAMNQAAAVSAISILAAASAGIGWETIRGNALEKERGHLLTQAARIAELDREREALAQLAAEIARFRNDDLELARIEKRAAAMRSQLEGQGQSAEISQPESNAASSSNAGLYPLRELDRVPSPKTQAAPRYPEEMRFTQTSGEVTVNFIVDKSGAVSDVRIVDSTHKGFEGPATKAVGLWTFEPGLKAGRPVATRVTVPIVFTISGGEKSWF
ncbi:MAG TPA: TonB family protein [Opitutaceae bacterium]|nr:TonB family protein [Opitutaceae bacterium]